MDMSNVLAFVAVATLLVVSPGPNGFLVTKTVSLWGQKAGFANVAGFLGAFYVHGTLSIFGISLLLVQSATAFFVFKMLGAAYLVWIGLKALKSAVSSKSSVNKHVHEKPRTAPSLIGAFLEGFVTNTLNPKVSMFYLAAFPQFMSQGSSAFDAYTLVAAHAMVNFLWFALMVVALSRVKHAANSERFKVWLNSITGIVFIGFGAKLALLRSS